MLFGLLDKNTDTFSLLYKKTEYSFGRRAKYSFKNVKKESG